MSILNNSFAQKLHNGIELPPVWPPNYGEPTERKEMPVPYLKNKPDVIPVNVGRQLFVDDYLISATNMTPIYHNAVFYSNNPVVWGDKELEKTTQGVPYADTFSDGVWYDELDNKFKMWYRIGAGMFDQRDHQTFYTSYAESADGINWIKPDLDIIKGTNVVDCADRDASTTWLDKSAKDPNRRYKLFTIERRPKEQRWQYVLKYSSDGIHWSKGVAQSGDVYDRSTAFYNPFTNKWVMSMRQTNRVNYRSRSYLECDDVEMAVSLAHRIKPTSEDKYIVYWFAPDEKEPVHPKYPNIKPGIYNFDANAYESLMLGFYSVWQGPDNDICDELGMQKRNEILLGYSRDGFHFSRPTHQIFMGVSENDGAWNWGNVQSAAGGPLIVGDSLYFYCSGKNNDYKSARMYASTGLAKLRRDGFVSMRASGKEEKSLLTEPIIFDGEYFFINADIKTKGKLQVELLNSDGNVVPGFSQKECQVIKINSTRHIVTWKKNPTVEPLQNKVVRVKFYMTDGDLYAFWISPWISGESRGYTGGGGPGLSPVGIDVPNNM